MGESNWEIREDAIVEQPRQVQKHPLLSEVYKHHDKLISEFLPRGESLEIAFGQYMHPQADFGVEAWPSNVLQIERPAIIGDARSLPFEDDTFDAVIGRRFLHHVPQEDRLDIIRESSRVLRSGGKVIILEGTPGLYRKLTKGVAFRLGILGNDSDIYGHLSRKDLYELVDSEFNVVYEKSLGSPVLIASISESELAEHLFPLYQRTQFVKWWTLIVGELG